MNSRDVANNCVQASALDARCKWTRDPATAGAGGSVLRNARRSILSPRAQGVICALDVSPSLNCAGWVCSAGDFLGRGA